MIFRKYIIKPRSFRSFSNPRFESNVGTASALGVVSGALTYAEYVVPIITDLLFKYRNNNVNNNYYLPKSESNIIKTIHRYRVRCKKNNKIIKIRSCIKH